MYKVNISAFDSTKMKNVGTVNTFINNLRNIQAQLRDELNGVSLFFRGHANKDWSLTPGIYRTNAAIKKEDYLIHNLIRHCPIDFQNCKSSFEKLVKMQHYELPTRLLDISMNPLVALYFAVAGETDKDGELLIFLIRNEDLSNFDDNWVNILSWLSFMPEEIVNVESDRKKWKILINNLRYLQEPIPYLKNADDLSKVLCVLPKLDNPRIIRQHGAFFLFGISKGMKENMAILDVSTIKMRIPSARKDEVLKQLDQLGINEKFCFPEIDKVAHYLKENI